MNQLLEQEYEKDEKSEHIKTIVQKMCQNFIINNNT